MNACNPNTILLIVHQKKSVSGHIGTLLSSLGYNLDKRCPCIGDPLPQNLENYAAVVVFGGPMSANDCDMEGIKKELDFIPDVLKLKIPFLGLCLGGQLLARVLGAKISPHELGHIESGFTKIYPTKIGEDWFVESDIFYQWHREGFDVPDGAQLLAKGDKFPNQAFRYKNAFGIQFHPEVNLRMHLAWLYFAGYRLSERGAQTRKEQLTLRLKYGKNINLWLDNFLDNHLLNNIK